MLKNKTASTLSTTQCQHNYDIEREQYSSHKLTASKATENDSADIWKWRNDTLTRKMSTTTDEVSWKAHSNWYNNSLKNTNRYLYVGIIEMFCVTLNRKYSV
jgi:hypothetical protein